MYELLIKNAMVIDGTGNDAYKADVVIHKGLIHAVGNGEGLAAKEVIDATGKFITPGFIDSHSHADCGVARFPQMENLTVQGVTTVCAGHCSMGVAPIPNYYFATMYDEEAMERVRPNLFLGSVRASGTTVVETELARQAYLKAYGVDLPWKSWGEFTCHMEKNGIGPNLLGLVGHALIRVQIMGNDFRRAASPNEIEQMCALLTQSMEEGANGLSFGFDYVPSNYAQADEIVRLASVVARYDGLVTAHVQHSGFRYGRIEEGFQPLRGFRELLEIGLETGVRVHISHLRPTMKGINDRYMIDAACQYLMDMIADYRAKGVRIGWDVLPNYSEAGAFNPMLAAKLRPYVEQCGSITEFQKMLDNPEYRYILRYELLNGLNPGAHPAAMFSSALPGWEHMHEIIACAEERYVGKTIGGLAEEKGIEAIDMLMMLLQTDPRACTRFVSPQKELIGFEYYATRPDVSIGLDVGALNYDCNMETREDMPPKYLGAYSDFSGMVYMMCLNAIPRREALIAAMTGQTAANLGLRDRGFIKAGMRADILLIDWDALDSNIDYIHPNRSPKGIECVWVNGVLTAHNGRALNPCTGQVIRNNDRCHD